MQRPAAFACFAAIALALVFGAACGSGSSTGARGGVTIEPLASSTAAAVPTGGKPAAPPPPATDAAATDTVESASTEAPAATATPAQPLTSDGSSAPAEGRWIDVDVTKFVVRLMDGAAVTREIGPVAVGEQVDTGEYASTQTGLFQVYNKVEDLAYDPPYDTYISHWVGFDPDKANGFHSFLKDKDGSVVDPRTGRISNGCIRTGAPEVVFAFAEIGMPVYVHH
jgi:L,D-transpeptidase catalytic domain